jgi:CxxC motif-containing protein
MKKKMIICTGCPLGCHMKFTLSPDGNMDKVYGNQCPQGKKHALIEFSHPARVLTSTVLTEGSSRHLLSVRTDEPIPIEKLEEVMRAIAGIRVKPPVKSGQEIVHNILGTGTNLVSTGSLDIDLS